jgi:hypothetical protein
MPERKLKNFILDQAHFAGVAGSYDEKMQRNIR